MVRQTPDSDQRQPIGRQHWLVHAKLEAPRQQVHLIKRPHLQEILDQSLKRRLGLVAAPAGFGKTTLVSQWQIRLQKQEIKVAWLTLDENDADTHQFLSYIIFALAEAGVPVGQLEMLAEQGLTDMSRRAALSTVIDVIARFSGKIVLVLDDYYRLSSPEIDALVRDLVTSSPPQFYLLIISRLRPAINLPQLLATGHAIEVTAEDLRFSPAETEQAFESPVSSEVLNALYERTEGWPVAVQLAQLLIHGKLSEDDLLKQFRGHSGHIASYLADQILATLGEKTQEFLIRTSILERFNASLANAVCQRQDGWDVLTNLENLQALLIPVDEHHEWYRYHRLFADYLLDLLRRRYPSREVGLHMTASRWFEDHDQVTEAVRHAQLAGDFDRCARLIERQGSWELILFGGIGQLRNLLRHIPDSDLARFPRLQLARVYILTKDGRIPEARALYDAVVSNPLAELQAGALQRDLMNIGSMLEIYEDVHVTPPYLDELYQRQQTIAPEDALSRGINDCMLALSTLAVGRYRETSRVCQTAMRAMRQAGSMPGLNYCYLHAGVAAFYSGQFRQAEAHLRESRRLAEDNFGVDSGLKFMSNVLLGAVVFWRGEQTARDKQDFLSALKHVEQHDGWFEIYAFGLTAAVEMGLAQNDRKLAEEAIAQARRVIDQRGLPRLMQLARAQQLKLSDKPVDDSRSSLENDVEGVLASCEVGCWKTDPYRWQPYVEIALIGCNAALEPVQYLERLGDAIECCHSLGNRFHHIRLLVKRGQTRQHLGDQDAALDDIMEAVQLAAPERIRQPFRSSPDLAPLMRNAQKRIREETGDSLLLQFLAECMTARTAPPGKTTGETVEAGLSPREQEVLQELALGSSNKVIARALDLTEHTVKFHLKNIFTKLQVENRTQAIARAQQLKLIF